MGLVLRRAERDPVPLRWRVLHPPGVSLIFVGVAFEAPCLLTAWSAVTVVYVGGQSTGRAHRRKVIKLSYVSVLRSRCSRLTYYVPGSNSLLDVALAARTIMLPLVSSPAGVSGAFVGARPGQGFVVEIDLSRSLPRRYLGPRVAGRPLDREVPVVGVNVKNFLLNCPR